MNSIIDFLKSDAASGLILICIAIFVLVGLFVINADIVKKECKSRYLNEIWNICYWARDGFLKNAAKIHPDQISETVLEAKRIIDDMAGEEISASTFDYILARNFLETRKGYNDNKDEIEC